MCNGKFIEVSFNFPVLFEAIDNLYLLDESVVVIPGISIGSNDL